MNIFFRKNENRVAKWHLNRYNLQNIRNFDKNRLYFSIPTLFKQKILRLQILDHVHWIDISITFPKISVWDLYVNNFLQNRVRYPEFPSAASPQVLSDPSLTRHCLLRRRFPLVKFLVRWTPQSAQSSWKILWFCET